MYIRVPVFQMVENIVSRQVRTTGVGRDPLLSAREEQVKSLCFLEGERHVGYGLLALFTE